MLIQSHCIFLDITGPNWGLSKRQKQENWAHRSRAIGRTHSPYHSSYLGSLRDGKGTEQMEISENGLLEQ